MSASAATTLPETLTVPAFTRTALFGSGFSQINLLTNPFNDFNPSLGNLTSISATINMGSFVWTVNTFGSNINTDSVHVSLLTDTPPTLNFLTGINPSPSVSALGSVTEDLSLPANQLNAPTTAFASLLDDFKGTGTTQLEINFDDNAAGGNSPVNTISSANGFSGTITYTYDPVATPLPAALSLFATGLGVIGLLAWLRTRMVGRHLTETGATIQN
jgi:hypothetical protein